MPAVAIALPWSGLADLRISDSDTAPKMIPSSDPRPPSQTMDRISDAIAKGLVRGGGGFQPIWAEGSHGSAGRVGGERYAGCVAGGYQRPSEACHHPGLPWVITSRPLDAVKGSAFGLTLRSRGGGAHVGAQPPPGRAPS